MKVKFRRCELFNRTLAKHKNIMPKLAEFIEFKTKNPLDRFGKKDQHFTGGVISDTKVIHCHLTSDISVLYYRSGRDPMLIDLVMIGTHDELGTGQPGNNKVQKQVAKAISDQTFEGKKMKVQEIMSEARGPNYQELEWKMDKFLPDDPELIDEYQDLLDQGDEEGLINFFHNEADFETMQHYGGKNFKLEDFVKHLLK